MLNFSTDIFRSVQMYRPHMWLWLGDAAYTDNIMQACKFLYLKIKIDKKDVTMPVEYVKERFQKTLDDPCKKKVKNSYENYFHCANI